MSNHYSFEEGIAIIGLGCVYPKASNIEQYWQNIVNKVSSIIDVPKTRWDSDIYYHPDKNMPDKTYSKIGGFVEDIDPKSLTIKYKIPPKTINAMDRAQQYALIAAGEALADAGYDKKDFDKKRTAVIIGNSMGGDQIDYSNLRAFFGDIEENLKKCANFSKLD